MEKYKSQNLNKMVGERCTLGTSTNLKPIKEKSTLNKLLWFIRIFNRVQDVCFYLWLKAAYITPNAVWLPAESGASGVHAAFNFALEVGFKYIHFWF